MPLPCESPIWLFFHCFSDTWVISVLFPLCVCACCWHAAFSAETMFSTVIESMLAVSSHQCSWLRCSCLQTRVPPLEGPLEAVRIHYKWKIVAWRNVDQLLIRRLLPGGASIYINLQPVWNCCHICVTALFSSEVNAIALKTSPFPIKFNIRCRHWNHMASCFSSTNRHVLGVARCQVRRLLINNKAASPPLH